MNLMNAIKIERIYDVLLSEMKAGGLEDTPENRLNMLNNLRNKLWNDRIRSIPTLLYLITINVEIRRLVKETS